MAYDRYWQAKKVTLIGAIVNAFLGFIKLISGVFFYSHALIADGIHSFSDLFTDIMVLFASRFGSQDADDTHPYGHQRIETAATLLLALLLILAGLGIAWDALDLLLHHTHAFPSWEALPIAILSIIANEILFHYTRNVGKKIRSPLILANAWHHRSDAASSGVVALGLLGTLMGFVYLDSIAAVIVGCMIIKMGLNYGWNSVVELVDTAVEPDILRKIEHIIQEFDGVIKIHQLRSRLMAGDILIDVHILVSPLISVSEGHFIAQQVHHTLMNQFGRIKDVIVHVDPEDDEGLCPSLYLPTRNTLEQDLLLQWKQQYPVIRNWTLHYLDGKMRIAIICRGELNQLDQISEQLSRQLDKFPFISEIRLLREMKVIYPPQN